MPKTVHVILAFHAHEPLWDLPAHLQAPIPDMRIAQAVPPENYLRRRAKEGRNIYRDLVAFAKTMGVHVTVDISNDLLYQIRTILPRTFEELRRAYQDHTIYPLYTTAHHTHAALLEPGELVEELRLNQEALHDLVGAPRPKRRVFFFTECSVHPRFAPALEDAGVDAIVHPHLSDRKGMLTLSDPSYDYVHRPFLIGRRLVALPRHFRVSQEIWRPVTRMYPQEVRSQGYMMGAYYVFDTEYKEHRYLDFPIDRARGVEEYAAIVREALAAAPDGGLILYIQDLELMDFGDVALDVLQASWRQVLASPDVTVKFATPDDYLDTLPGPPEARADHQGMGWAPETRVLLRSDGQYPPLYAGETGGVDAVPAIFRPHPFIYWEPGKYVVGLFGWLLRAFGLLAPVGVHASVLCDEGYQLYRFPIEKRIAVGFRLLKQADNWGWQPSEALNKRPYLYGLMLADALMMMLQFYPERFPATEDRLDPRLLVGLGRLPEGLLDTRIAYLRFGLERLREERHDYDPSEPFRQLDYATDFRDKAGRGAEHLLDAYRALDEDFRNAARWRRVLLEAREHCRNVFLSLDHLQRTWMAAGEVDFLIDAMYRYLYDLYPPRFPEILDQVDRGTAAERVYLGTRLVHFAIPAESPVAGRRLSALAVSPDSLVIALRRGTRMLVPRGDTVLQGGDRITVATTRSDGARLEDIVAPR
ncbi:MAG TPA: TrkA C-terminal domain-containing protein [bacterium]|nr:TrkA C-terminal domain-containing protein [bacterium]